MEVTQEMIDNALSGATEQLKENLVKELQAGISWNIKEEISRNISCHVKEWMTENILPEVTAELIAGKESIVEAISKNITNAFGKDLGGAMTKTLHENLQNSYKRGEIFKHLFG